MRFPVFPLKASGHGVARWVARHLARRPFRLRAGRPIVSFTFDDFPRTAWTTGGKVLARHGVTATYYASFGLAGTEGASGRNFTHEDVHDLLSAGHELGCHTHAHCPAWETDPDTFAESVRRNREHLGACAPRARFRTLSYPISPPRAATKRRMGRTFVCCRGGGQTYNSDLIDLNCLHAFFLEQAASDVSALAAVIAASASAGGWLILATHDVADHPSRFGVTPAHLEQAVQLVRASGAEILPVAAAWDKLSAHAAP